MIIDLIKEEEGFRLKPYKCTAGKLSIGYGRNLEDNGIRKDEAELMLSNDIKQATQDAIALFPSFSSLTEARQAVLVSMSFNLGKSRLAQFKGLMLAVASKAWDNAAAEILDSLAARQLPKRYKKLSVMMAKG